MKVAVIFVVIAGLHLLSSVSPASVETPETVRVYPPTNIGQSKQEIKGECECAVFNTETPEPDDKPLLSKSPMEVVCDESGKVICQTLCSTLARVAQQHANDTLCLVVRHVVNLKPSIFSRVCNESAYSFTGVTSKEAYCCHENKAIGCTE